MDFEPFRLRVFQLAPHLAHARIGPGLGVILAAGEVRAQPGFDIPPGQALLPGLPEQVLVGLDQPGQGGVFLAEQHHPRPGFQLTFVQAAIQTVLSKARRPGARRQGLARRQLCGRGGREQHGLGMRAHVLDQLLRPLGGKLLGDIQADHQVVGAVERPGIIAGLAVGGRRTGRCITCLWRAGISWRADLFRHIDAPGRHPGLAQAAHQSAPAAANVQHRRRPDIPRHPLSNLLDLLRSKR